MCLFVSVLTSSFLLAVCKAGRFSGAGLLLRKVVLKSVQKDLEESVAAASFHPWMPFGSVHTAWTSQGIHCCQHALGAGGRRNTFLAVTFNGTTARVPAQQLPGS